VGSAVTNSTATPKSYFWTGLTGFAGLKPNLEDQLLLLPFHPVDPVNPVQQPPFVFACWMET
jgi:hypothetical protein